MDLADARTEIERTFERMRAKYGEPVFDEWAVVAAGAAPHGGVRAYVGPRGDAFRANFAQEVEPLQRQMAGRELEIGDFDFALDGAGSRHDAVMKIGAHTFLVCNHTAKSIDEIRANPRWLEAQAPLVQLSEKFRQDGVEI